MGVFTGSSGNALRHWNILLPSEEPIGRIPTTGLRQYYAKDHLGSVRAESGAITEATDYYAFGLDMGGRRFVSGTSAREHFTGKERDQETGFDYFGARYYMPEIGRWLVVDPLTEYIRASRLSSTLAFSGREETGISGAISPSRFAEQTSKNIRPSAFIGWFRRFQFRRWPESS